MFAGTDSSKEIAATYARTVGYRYFLRSKPHAERRVY